MYMDWCVLYRESNYIEEAMGEKIE
jgi:hypothetical protein